MDLEKIKAKLNKLENRKPTPTVNYFKPDPTKGKQTIRVLPYKSADDQPFEELWFYYGIGNRSYLALSQFDKADPIKELISDLHSDGTAEAKEMAKKLYPKMRVYAPVIVRGEEEKGVQIWAFSKTVYKKLLAYFVDEDCGDFTDLTKGRDMTVTCSKPPGKALPDTDVQIKVSASPTSKDAALVQQWVSSIPNIRGLFKEPSFDELKNAVQEWMSGAGETAASAKDDSSLGTEATVPVTKTAATPAATKGGSKAKVAIDDELEKFLNEE